MDRRAFITIVGGGILITPLAVEAQQGGKVPRIGYIAVNPRSVAQVNIEAFEQGLRELGYTLGQNVNVEYRSGQGSFDRIPVLVREVLRLDADVLCAFDPYVVRVAREATATVPIVALDLETDPVAAGWVSSWAHPGGNLTGLFLDLPELSGKHVEFLTAAIPNLRRIAVLWDVQISNPQFKATVDAAKAAGLSLQSLGFHEAGEFDAALKAARQQRAQALVLLSSPRVFRDRKRLANLALQYRLPAISIFHQFASEGGLMAYGPDLQHLFRAAASYVDRVLKGTRPADLPIQRPTVFTFTVNSKTAKALGLTIPQSLLIRADEIIQ